MKENEETIRVAQVIGKMAGGGVESFIMNYYRNIDKSKIQFDFIIDSDSTVVPRKEIENMGGRIIEVPPYQQIFKYIKTLKKIFKDNDYKIVHSHLNSLSVFPLYCAKRVKVPIRIAHSHSTTNKKEWKKDLLKNVLKRFSKLYANQYFACSEHAAKWLFGKRTFSKGKITIIHNAIDVEKFKYNEKTRKEIRERLNIENKLVIGNVGRFMKQKNHDLLIDIFNEIHKYNKDTVLLLIGEGPLENEIKQKVNELGLEKCVCFLGVINNVNEYMQAMDVFLFPSLYEGLGMVLVEAQTAGLKCITSTEVPREVKLTELVEFIPLREPIELWKNSVLENIDTNRETKVTSSIRNKNYDIKTESRKIVEKYFELLDFKGGK